eukprot:727069-Pleurochrysis_carterae.AAC.3
MRRERTSQHSTVPALFAPIHHFCKGLARSSRLACPGCAEDPRRVDHIELRDALRVVPARRPNASVRKVLGSSTGILHPRLTNSSLPRMARAHSAMRITVNRARKAYRECATETDDNQKRYH